MAKKTVPVKPHKRSTPSPTPRKNPDAPKPGPKTVPVDPHKRSRPKSNNNANAQQPHTLSSRSSQPHEPKLVKECV